VPPFWHWPSFTPQFFFSPLPSILTPVQASFGEPIFFDWCIIPFFTWVCSVFFYGLESVVVLPLRSWLCFSSPFRWVKGLSPGPTPGLPCLFCTCFMPSTCVHFSPALGIFCSLQCHRTWGFFWPRRNSVGLVTLLPLFLPRFLKKKTWF